MLQFIENNRSIVVIESIDERKTCAVIDQKGMNVAAFILPETVEPGAISIGNLAWIILPRSLEGCLC